MSAVARRWEVSTKWLWEHRPSSLALGLTAGYCRYPSYRELWVGGEFLWWSWAWSLRLEGWYMSAEPKVLRHWIDTIQDEGRGLTKWEHDFVASVEEQLDLHGTLTERQEEILERIYAEKTP